MDSFEKAARLLAESTRAVAFTGAGISADSGIATFRGKGGLWEGRNEYRIAGIVSFMKDPSIFWTEAATLGLPPEGAEPNAAHLALAEMERQGRLLGVITQNVDGFHQKAGSQVVAELHGTGTHCVCLNCSAREERETVQARLKEEMPPRCQHCGSELLKPAMTMFGERLPEQEWQLAEQLVRQCDLMLVVGSSLAVYPAAELPERVLEMRKPVVLLNLEPVMFDPKATCVIHGRAVDVLPELCQRSLGGLQAAP